MDSDEIVSAQNYKMYDVGLYGKYALTGESNFEPYAKLSVGVNFLKFATWVGQYNTILREISYDPVFSGAGYLGAMYYTSDFGAIFVEAGYHIVKSKYTQGKFQDRIFSMPEDVKYAEVRAGVIVFFGPEGWADGFTNTLLYEGYFFWLKIENSVII